MEDQAQGEILEIKPSPNHTPTGHFAKGNRLGGRPRGAVGRYSQKVLLSIIDKIAKGEGKHPSVVLFEMSNDEKLDPRVRVQAARELCSYMLPKQSEVTVGLGDPDREEDEQAKTQRLLIALESLK